MADFEREPIFPDKTKIQEAFWVKFFCAAVVTWLVFVLQLAIFGFRLHDMYPTAVWIFGAVCVLLCGIVALTAYWTVKFHPHIARWRVVHAFSLVAATLCGIGLGDQIYWSQSWQYYQLQKSSPYVDVDPSKAKGQSMMDAGQVYFKEGTFVATEEAIAYQMSDIYCAAPIVRQPVADYDVEPGEKAVLTPYSGTIDFWAVGVNCCMPSGELFRCYDAKNSYARSGTRLLRDDLRPFFKLAVEKWSSKYSMPVKHPLFFYWMNDPISAIDNNEYEARWRFWAYFASYFFINCGVVYLSREFSKRIGL